MIDALSPLIGLTDLALRMETVVAEVENACGPTRLFYLIQSDVTSSLVYEMAIWAVASHPPTLSWVPPDTSPACQATGRASCAYVCRALSFVLFLPLAEKNRLELPDYVRRIPHNARWEASQSVAWNSPSRSIMER